MYVYDNGSGIVANTTIGGNLECLGNTGGVSDLGSTNSVSGRKIGQCAGAAF